MPGCGHFSFFKEHRPEGTGAREMDVQREPGKIFLKHTKEGVNELEHEQISWKI